MICDACFRVKEMISCSWMEVGVLPEAIDVVSDVAILEVCKQQGAGTQLLLAF